MMGYFRLGYIKDRRELPSPLYLFKNIGEEVSGVLKQNANNLAPRTLIYLHFCYMTCIVIQMETRKYKKR